MVTGESDGLRS